MRVLLAAIFFVLASRHRAVASSSPPPSSSPSPSPSASSSDATAVTADGVGARYSDTAPSTPASSSLNHGGSSSRSSGAVTFLYELYEHEIYNQKTDSWTSRRFTQSPVAGGGGRDSTSLDPQRCSPPRNYAFDGEWKIDMASDSRDGFGWEYYVGRYDGLGRRRRRWVRSLTRMRSVSLGGAPPAASAGGATGVATSFAGAGKGRKSATTTATAASGGDGGKKRGRGDDYGGTDLLRALRDQYTFKGFGWSINKSLVFARSVGATFRVPLSANFDGYERYRAAPFVSTGAYFGYPWAAAALLNASVPVEAVHWAAGGVAWKVRWAAAVASALLRCAAEAAVWAVLWPRRLWGAAARRLAGVAGGGCAGTGRDGDDSPESAIDGGMDGPAVAANDLVADASDGGSPIVSIETHIEVDSASVAAVVDSPRGGASDASRVSSPPFRRRRHLTMFGGEIPPFHRTTTIEYSSVIQERLGVSLSWRLSRVRGYEYRCNFFFSCMPTRIFWGQVEEERRRQVDRVRRAVDFRGNRDSPTSSAKKQAGTTEVNQVDEDNIAGRLDVQSIRSKSQASSSSMLSSFLSEHFSAVGISTGWPLPMEPYFALNLVLSLSGFYYGWLLEYIRSIFVPSLRGKLELKNEELGHIASSASSEKLVSSALKKNMPLEEEADDVAETDNDTSITKKAIL